MKKSVLLFLACSVLLLAACQKTPGSVMDGNVLRAKSSNDLLVESLVNAPADNGRSGEGVPTLAESEHLKRDISSGGITVHIDADIKVPKITGDIRTYSAQYRFFDLLELEDLFFSGDDPMFNPGSEKTAEDDPSAGLLPGGFFFGVSEVLSASNHPTALKPGWAKGCNISPDDARRLSDKLLGRLGMTDFELVSSQVVEPLTERGNRAKRGRYEYKYVQVADGIPLSSGEPDSTGCTVAIDDRGVVDARLTRLELGESKIVNSRVMTLDGVLAVLQKKLAAAGLVKDSIVKEISFEYMSVEDPETYNSTVFPCWRFCIATTATLEQYGEYENDIIINAVTGEFYAVTNRYE